MILGMIGPGSISLVITPILLVLLILYYWRSWKKRKNT